jgi:uncharacterized protein YjbI with pentapeptide repeats
MIEDDGRAHGWSLFRLKPLTEPKEEVAAAVYAVASIIAVLIGGSGLIALCQLLIPEWTLERPAPGFVAAMFDADPEAELRGRLIIVGAVLTTPFLLWRLIVSHLAARAAQDQARIAQETARNSLFTKAIEHLGAMREATRPVHFPPSGQPITDKVSWGSPSIEVRLGAIYALEKLARDDHQMHWPIMETLCAYVRVNAGPPSPPDEKPLSIWGKCPRTGDEEKALKAYIDGLLPRSVDVQAALSVIGRRKAQRERERIPRDDPTPSSAGAWRLDLTHSNLTRANLDGLDLAGARLDESALMLAHCDRARLAGVSLHDGHLEGASLTEAHLTGARLVSAHLECAWMENAQLEKAHLECASFGQACLEGASLGHACLNGAALTGTDLTGAKLVSARLEDARMEKANLKGASLEQACLEGASLEAAVIEDALIDGARLESAKSLTQAQLDAAWGDAETTLPANLIRPANERWLPAGADSEARKGRIARWEGRRSYWLAESRKRREAVLPSLTASRPGKAAQQPLANAKSPSQVVQSHA